MDIKDVENIFAYFVLLRLFYTVCPTCVFGFIEMQIKTFYFDEPIIL